MDSVAVWAWAISPGPTTKQGTPVAAILLASQEKFVTVLPRTFRVHLHALGGWGMTLPWLKDSSFPSREAKAR